MHKAICLNDDEDIQQEYAAILSLYIHSLGEREQEILNEL